MGATMTINPAKGESIEGAIEELKMHGFDIGLEMSGSPQAFDSMISNMYNGSKIALLGICLTPPRWIGARLSLRR